MNIFSGQNNDHFYERLPGFRDFNAFYRLRWYLPLPNNWLVVITDVEGSTQAISEGRYKDVNAVGVASIVALINAVKPLNVPFVFGGDGATICVPPTCKGAVVAALIATRQMAVEQFGLQLRIGVVPMAELKRRKQRVLVGKYQPSGQYQQAMFLGEGLDAAEALIKDPTPDNPYLIDREGITPYASFTGFECRWNEVPSPHGENVTILVKALAKDAFTRKIIYKDVLNKIYEIYGPEQTHHPLRPEGLSLSAAYRRLSQEIKIVNAFHSFAQRWFYGLKLKILVYMGRWMMARKMMTANGDWGNYKANLIANSDFRKFDGVLRMIIAGTAQQREKLIATFREFREQGKIAYGLHVSATALITCVISDYKTDHIHFLDGANGGYALAAKGLKAQLREML